MNWFKAKNLILISLVALNILLMALIYITNDNYILSNEQVENMYKVLSSKYNIGIYAQLPKRYEPMKEIEVINEGEDTTSYLYNTFFSNGQDVHKLEDGDKIIFQGEDKTLMTQSGDFVLSSSEGLTETKEQLLKYMQKSTGDYFLYDKYIVDNHTVYDYRQKFKNEIIYTNYLIIEENEEGKVSKIEGYYAKPSGFIGDSREIVPIDMVLFNFANFYPKSENEQLFIDSVDLVYNQEQIMNEPNVILKATPCYLIKVRGSVVPVKVDAYTNTILTK